MESHTQGQSPSDTHNSYTIKEMISMTTTPVRAAMRERIDPVLEEMITRELIGQSALPSTIPAAQQPPSAQLAALAPALIAAMVSQQPQQVPVPLPPSPLAALLPVLTATLAAKPQPVPVPQTQQFAALFPAL